VTHRILVTRPAAQSAELCALLAARGLEPIAAPTVEIDTASSAADLDAMLERLAGAAWLVLTSANGAVALVARIAATGRHLPDDVRVAAVGPATAGALEAAGIQVDHVPDAFLTAPIADGLGDLDGRRVVLARADAATPALHDALVARGALVEEVVAYRTIEGPGTSRDAVRDALATDLGGIAFTSGSTVRGLVRLAPNADRAIPAHCIGPVTAAEARRAGFEVAVVADEHTAIGLTDAIATHLLERAR